MSGRHAAGATAVTPCQPSCVHVAARRGSLTVPKLLTWKGSAQPFFQGEELASLFGSSTCSWASQKSFS